MSVLLLVLGLVLFVGLVVVHEWGHFIVARRNDVEVEEFGIGFPPKAWARKLKSGMLFSINWLPIGGFVRLKGENDADKRPHSFGAASLGAKSRIMMAGVGMNLLTAFIFLTILAWLGMPKLVDNQFTISSDTKVVKNQVLIGYLEPDSPAAKAGLKELDHITAFKVTDESGTKVIYVNSQDQLPEVTGANAGKEVEITYIRGGEASVTTAQLRSAEEVEASKNTDEPKGYLGISPSEYTLTRSTWSAPIVALGLMKQFTVLTLQGIGSALGNLIMGNGAKASEQVAGPVGIVTVFSRGTLLGYQFILLIVAIISLTLAIINALPIPALDGGRLFVTWLFHIMRWPLTKKKEEFIHGTGFAMLMVLFVLITIVDIRRL